MVQRPRIFALLLILAATFLGVSTSVGASSRIAKHAPMTSHDFQFVSGGRKLSGVIDQPAGERAKALVIFVHGSGATNVRAEKPYLELRRRFADIGIASVMWDKPGKGRSEGSFDDNQPLEESAREVVDAIAQLRAAATPGSGKIGIWATSRGTWVAPIAMSHDRSIRFWISVSGASGEDNKYYLMKSNLPLEGRSPAQTGRLMDEWRAGRRIFLQGGDYESYLAATKNLRADPAIFYLAGNLTGSKEDYDGAQQAYLKSRDRYQFDPRTLSMIRVPDFAQMLSGLGIDVLAIFGEKDMNIDWRNTRALYQSTFGRNPRAGLTVRTFPSCNHAMNISQTGWIREVEGTPIGSTPCDGYYETQTDWLRQHVLGKRP